MKKFIMCIVIVLSFICSIYSNSTSVDAKKYLLSGNEKMKKGDYFGASLDYTMAVSFDTKYAEAYYSRGVSYLKTKIYYSAITDFTKAIELNPTFAQAYYARGMAKKQNFDNTGAEVDISKARELGYSGSNDKNTEKNNAIESSKETSSTSSIESIPTPKNAVEKKPTKFINPTTSGNAKFETYLSLDDQIFPVMIVSLIEAAKKQAAEKTSNSMLGSYNGAFEIIAQSIKPNTKIKVTVFPNHFITEQTESEFVLQDPKILYNISPMVAWDFEKLTQLTQPTNETFKIGIQVDGKEMNIKTFQPRIRSINDCILSYVDRYGNLTSSTAPLFSAYVNENNPKIDEILKEAKELSLKAKIDVAFSGYQGDAAGQVGLLWFLFQTKHFIYSSITQESGTSSKVASQHVRSLEDSYSATQANCVDGSVLFASILKKIGIKSFLILKPGHCYLMFFSQENKAPWFVETTMLGNYHVKKAIPVLHPIIYEYSNSLKSFQQANTYATNTFNKDLANYKSGKLGYYMVDIDACRLAGITPINR